MHLSLRHLKHGRTYSHIQMQGRSGELTRQQLTRGGAMWPRSSRVVQGWTVARTCPLGTRVVLTFKSSRVIGDISSSTHSSKASIAMGTCFNNTSQRRNRGWRLKDSHMKAVIYCFIRLYRRLQNQAGPPQLPHSNHPLT